MNINQILEAKIAINTLTMSYNLSRENVALAEGYLKLIPQDKKYPNAFQYRDFRNLITHAKRTLTRMEKR